MNSPNMTCPNDGAQLVMSERQGIEIDYCPSCRGVWLDRGELDKIVERSAPSAGPLPASRDCHEPVGRYGHRPKRRKSFFEELFD